MLNLRLLFVLAVLTCCKIYATKYVNQAKFRAPMDTASDCKQSISSALKIPFAATLNGFISSLSPQRAFAASKAGGNLSTLSKLSIEEFYLRYPYQQPRDILRYLYEQSMQGDRQSVISALDLFADRYPMYKLSPRKAEFLSGEIRRFKPRKVLEIGTFFGYSALHIAGSMSKDCQLCCIEGNSENAEVALAVLRWAFFMGNRGEEGSVLDRIRIVRGLSSEVLRSPRVRTLLLEPGSTGVIELDGVKGYPLSADTFPEDNSKGKFDFLFLDHDKDCYLPDMLTLEKLSLLDPIRTEIVADNVLFPGAPEFLGYVNAAESVSVPKSDNGVAGDGSGQDEEASRWSTRLERMPFERVGFETQFKVVEDAMSVSTRGND